MAEKYQCEGCSATFEGTPEEAFEEGWDTPERFMSHCTCPNCSIDKTIWWRLVVLEEPPESLTEAEVLLLQSYNRLYDEAREGKDDP